MGQREYYLPPNIILSHLSKNTFDLHLNFNPSKKNVFSIEF